MPGVYSFTVNVMVDAGESACLALVHNDAYVTKLQAYDKDYYDTSSMDLVAMPSISKQTMKKQGISLYSCFVFWT